MSRLIRPILPLLCFAAALTLAGCGQGKPTTPPANANPPPAVVTVLRATLDPTPLTAELPGRTAAHLIAEVRPQVTGIIKERRFDEGSEVQAGQLLYLIDPAPYQAMHDNAKAGLARAEANLHAAQLKARRYTDLARSKAASQQDVDETDAALKQADAEVGAAKAALQTARINLDYTEVKAPVTGRIGRSLVTPGALVTANQLAPLAIIQQLDPIYADFTQSSAQILRIRRDLEAGRLQRAGEQRLTVRLILEDDSEYPLDGELAFAEVSVDQGTGSVTLRARFPNPNKELLPGMYVRGRVTLGTRQNAILVPHGAVSRTPAGKSQVMLVNDEGKVEARDIRTVQSKGDKWVVTEGLQAGDRIIIEGLQKARPGAPVTVEEAAAPASAPASAGRG